MAKKIMFGMLLISIFILSSILILMPLNNQSNEYITGNTTNILTNSSVNVTNPSDFEILAGDTTIHTVSWTLTDTNSSDYLGIFSFTNDPDGGVPINWTRPYRNSNTDGKVISEKAGHRKVIELYDNNPGGYTVLRYTFAERESGTIEWWFYGTASGSLSSLQLGLYKYGYGGIGLYFNTSWSELGYYRSTNYTRICDLSNNQWHHCRIQFNCVNDSFDMWIDGINRITSAPFDYPVTGLDTFDLYTGGTSTGGFYTYIDGIDYSWAPGYYLNRNMAIEQNLKDYFGAYSFTNDTDGSVPSGWTRPYHDSNTDGKIIAEQAGHHKVLETYDNIAGGYTILEQDFGAQTAGTVEVWYYGVMGTGPSCNLQLCIHNYWGYSGVYLILNFSYSQIGYWDTTYHKICDSANDQWHHLRIMFNCGSDTYEVWMDGIQRISNAVFQFPQANLTKVVIYTGGASTGGYYCYFDAFDYSWAPGYYLNRNMDYTNNTHLTYAIFNDGIQETVEQTWSNQITVAYNVTGTSLGSGLHNISLVFNDRSENWFHDDVEITVTDSNTISYYVPTTITIKIDIGIGASRKGDISFIFLNTGNTTFANINFTIDLPTGWTAKPSVYFVNQVAPGQNATIEFRLTLPKNVSEVSELVLIDIEAVIPELGIIWTTPEPIQVFVNKFESADVFIWVIVIVGSASAAVATTYVYIHRRTAVNKVSIGKPKGKTLASLKAAISADFPGPYAVLSVELIEKINSISGLTDEERQLLIEDVGQLDEEQAKKWIDAFEKTLTQ